MSAILLRDGQGIVRFERTLSGRGESLKGTKKWDDNEKARIATLHVEYTEQEVNTRNKAKRIEKQLTNS